jgi:pimeloyl-ACP methyl ester carboxylesterase
VFDVNRFSSQPIIVFVIAIILSACSPQNGDSRTTIGDSAKRPLFSACRLPSLSMAVECANITVPLKRDYPQSQETISLRIVRLPANTLRPDPDPLIFLAGGPGQAASALAPFASALVEIRRTRDIFLIDQRGTGESSPLSCAALRDDPDATLAQSLDQEMVTRVHRCLDELRAKNINPLDYGTLAFVEDIEDVRRMLSLKTINMWAGSYGTRVALEYLRRYPENVRTLTLDGVVSPSRSIIAGGWQTREERLNDVIRACALSESCGKLQLEKILQTLITKFPPSGKRTTITNPRTGTSETVLINFDTIIASLQFLLYTPENAALIPYLIEQIAADRFEPLAAATQSFSRQIEGQLSPALHFSVLCAEDTQMASQHSNLSLTRSLYRQSLEACAPWPIADNFSSRIPVINNNTPVLLLSGTLDPVTPPAYAEEVAKTLAKHRAVVAKNHGHIISTQSCAPSLLAAFIKTADTKDLPEDCVNLLGKSAPSFLWSNALFPEP